MRFFGLSWQKRQEVNKIFVGCCAFGKAVFSETAEHGKRPPSPAINRRC